MQVPTSPLPTTVQGGFKRGTSAVAGHPRKEAASVPPARRLPPSFGMAPHTRAGPPPGRVSPRSLAGVRSQRRSRWRRSRLGVPAGVDSFSSDASTPHPEPATSVCRRPRRGRMHSCKRSVSDLSGASHSRCRTPQPACKGPHQRTNPESPVSDKVSLLAGTLKVWHLECSRPHLPCWFRHGLIAPSTLEAILRTSAQHPPQPQNRPPARGSAAAQR